MITRVEVDAWADATGIELLCADGFDDAIVGIGLQFTKYFVIYDRARCLQILVERDGMSEDDAEEYFDFNVTGAWVGDATPCFLVEP